MPQITIKVIGAEEILSNNISQSIDQANGFKYTYLKQMISRLRIVKSTVKDLDEQEQIAAIGNALIVERNVANYAAGEYAKLNQESIFDSLMEIVDEIEALLR